MTIIMNKITGFVIISLILAVKMNLAALPCDSVEYVMEEKDIRQYAAGICGNYGGTSEKLQCLPDGSDIYQLEYFGANCQGTPFKIAPLLSLLTDQYNFNISNFTVNCCTGYQCKYAKLISEEVDSCNTGDIITNTVSDETALMDLCIAPSYPSDLNRRVTCQNNSFVVYEYDESKNCDSNPEDFSDILYQAKLKSFPDCQENQTRTILCDQIAEKQCTGESIPIPTLTTRGLISNYSGIFEAYPADFCWTGAYGDVQKMECSDDGTDIYFFKYEDGDAECHSNPLYNFSVIEAYQQHGLGLIDYTIFCETLQSPSKYPSQAPSTQAPSTQASQRTIDQEGASSNRFNHEMGEVVMMFFVIFALL